MKPSQMLKLNQSHSEFQPAQKKRMKERKKERKKEVTTF
jgi:hypothetical protein